MNELPLFLVIAGVIAAVGMGLGILVAPRFTRLAERDDKESGDDEPG